MATSVTTAEDKNHRPTKRRALSPASKQAANVEALFANPSAALKDASGPKSKELAPPPEIVTNVQGSSAGAGSGEFHVYKASRRREYERLRLMDEESRKEEEDAQYEREREERLRKDEQKTSKNRKRRDKLKQRKDKKGVADGDGDTKMKANGAPQKAKLQANTTGGAPVAKEGDEDDNMPGVEEQGIVIHDDD
ncbi:Hypothetical protein D9617_38g090700 [Elsinoe fawcettii]|nr:Hypothetical protein D9617_38g090700 [Elsinoe fawcettii]